MACARQAVLITNQFLDSSLLRRVIHCYWEIRNHTRQANWAVEEMRPKNVSGLGTPFNGGLQEADRDILCDRQ